MQRNHVTIAATAGVAAGVLGLTVLSVPAGAGPDPSLPQVAPEKLVESVLRADEPAMSGTVAVSNELGLPAMPGAPATLANGESTLRVWADGQGRQRMSVPSPGGELTTVHDGTTVWRWDSAKQTVQRGVHRPDREQPVDPAAAARHFVERLRQTSAVTVDGTANVANRDAYELVLTPKPTERTVLREVRVAVDAEHRLPLQVTVHTHGTDSPALQVGFSEVRFAPSDPALFQFSPPEGAKVAEPKLAHRPDAGPKMVGDGWDTVVVSQSQRKAAQDPTALARQVGKQVSGSWGRGWLIQTKAGSALVTDDGRVAVGAVPEQVLTEALGNA